MAGGSRWPCMLAPYGVLLFLGNSALFLKAQQAFPPVSPKFWSLHTQVYGRCTAGRLGRSLGTCCSGTIRPCVQAGFQPSPCVVETLYMNVRCNFRGRCMCVEQMAHGGYAEHLTCWLYLWASCSSEQLARQLAAFRHVQFPLDRRQQPQRTQHAMPYISEILCRQQDIHNPVS